jgi:putative aldouronate transport system permease protein
MARAETLRIPRRNKIKFSSGERAYQIAIVSIVSLFTALCVFPLIYVIGMSLTTEYELIQRNWFVIIPWKPTLRAYELIFTRTPIIYNSLLITVSRALLGIPAGLILVVPGGYILAKYDLPGRKMFVMFLVVTMILSGGLIPSYILMQSLGLLNTFWIYIVPGMGATYSMLIIKLFVENMPGELMESADLDGASEMQKMFYIAIPLLVPTICALSLFSVVGHWNDWFTTMIYVNDQMLYPIQFVIRIIMVSTVMQDNVSGAITMMERSNPQSVKMASVVVAVFPVLCVYPFLQKYFIYGVYTGSVKG